MKKYPFKFYKENGGYIIKDMIAENIEDAFKKADNFLMRYHIYYNDWKYLGVKEINETKK